ncbi:hypothetical protein L596_001975 [Steinernema carpocapsae]|uniref:Uncharacterized protein n=2 Tax=Steinernema carpocapsae TaxID=34508 RepID=A0A4U8UN29_STECR|nr:hypothetical protein L596_001975 [Steinernema carpocapsae]
MYAIHRFLGSYIDCFLVDNSKDLRTLEDLLFDAGFSFRPRIIQNRFTSIPVAFHEPDKSVSTVLRAIQCVDVNVFNVLVLEASVATTTLCERVEEGRDLLINKAPANVSKVLTKLCVVLDADHLDSIEDDELVSTVHQLEMEDAELSKQKKELGEKLETLRNEYNDLKHENPQASFCFQFCRPLEKRICGQFSRLHQTKKVDEGIQAAKAEQQALLEGEFHETSEEYAQTHRALRDNKNKQEKRKMEAANAFGETSEEANGVFRLDERRVKIVYLKDDRMPDFDELRAQMWTALKTFEDTASHLCLFQGKVSSARMDEIERNTMVENTYRSLQKNRSDQRTVKKKVAEKEEEIEEERQRVAKQKAQDEEQHSMNSQDSLLEKEIVAFRSKEDLEYYQHLRDNLAQQLKMTQIPKTGWDVSKEATKRHRSLCRQRHWVVENTQDRLTTLLNESNDQGKVVDELIVKLTMATKRVLVKLLRTIQLKLKVRLTVPNRKLELRVKSGFWPSHVRYQSLHETQEIVQKSVLACFLVAFWEQTEASHVFIEDIPDRDFREALIEVVQTSRLKKQYVLLCENDHI